MAMLQEANYEQKEGPPRTPWDDYVRTATEQWHQLLESDPPEESIQRFLEEHPAFVPGAWTPPPLKSGHCPFLRALISQPRLPGFNHRQPDFLWVSTHSLEWFPTLIEIERPGKKLFTKEGVPTADFTQARNQLAQWRTWFSDPTNVQTFVREYGIPDYLVAGAAGQASRRAPAGPAAVVSAPAP
jgi:hypothetical protein